MVSARVAKCLVATLAEPSAPVRHHQALPKRFSWTMVVTRLTYVDANGVHPCFARRR